MASDAHPVANGLRTDHPIPNLPFIDDSHIPIEDPRAIEAIGRHHGGTDMWGRCDNDSRTGEWVAFTTDPKNHAFGWIVRYHPEHGRSVTLYRASDTTTAYHDWFSERPLLRRAGGYWWDGQTWYRPEQVLNWASEKYMRRPVRLPTTVTAEDLLDGNNGSHGQVGKITDFQPGDPVPAAQWHHDLAGWAQRRAARTDVLPLDGCVVTLNAPELTDTALLGVEEFAQQAGIAASTLRAYLARDEADIPLPQVTDGRKRWSRPVVQDWIERRRRDSAASALSGTEDDTLPVGLRRLWDRLTEALFHNFWTQTAARRRWARPHRTEPAVRELAREAGWTAAMHLDSTIPYDDLIWIIWQGLVSELGDYTPHHDLPITLSPQAERVLGWLVEHKPDRCASLFGTIVRHAEEDQQIPPAMTIKSLREAVLSSSSGIQDREHLAEYLDATLPPQV